MAAIGSVTPGGFPRRLTPEAPTAPLAAIALKNAASSNSLPCTRAF